MISNRSEEGLDLLDAMAGVAAQKALSHLAGAIRFAKCDSVQVNEGFSAPDVDLEAWAVLADTQEIVVFVLATAPCADGGRRTAGTGRFTFTAVARKWDCRV